MAFLIPLAGLALGALGRLISQKRTQQALGSASAAASANTPSETGLSTAATGTGTTNTSRPATPATGGQSGMRNTGMTGVGIVARKPEEGVPATQPATGPVQQNQGTGSPTPASGQDAGMAARLGQEAVDRSRRRNKKQQERVSNSAPS